MKLATVAVAGLCAAGLLCAQSSQTETTTTKTVNLNGTLIDQTCYTTHSHEKASNANPNGTTTTTETTKITTECPPTVSTTSFGLLTPDGKVVHFDDSSNTKVVEMMKSNKQWETDLTEHRPVKVRVVALPNGDLMVIKEIK